MTSAGRSPGFWIVIVFLAVSIVLMLVGQTLSVFNYDLAVSMGLQEKPGFRGAGQPRLRSC